MLNQPFANKWLNRAIGWELLLLLLDIYLPYLHAPFNTFSLTLRDWVIVTLTAVTVILVLEMGKWLVRQDN